MRVLHVIPSIAPQYGGPSQVTLETCRQLNLQGIDAAIATTSANGSGALDVNHGHWIDYCGVETIFFPRNFSEAFKYSRGLANWLGKNVDRFDVVHIHAVFSHSTLSAGRACLKNSVPYIVRPLGSLDAWSLQKRMWIKQLLLNTSIGRILSGAQAVHFTSELERAGSGSLAASARSVVIPIGVNPPMVENSDNTYGDYILYLGRIHLKKKLPFLVESFANLKRQRDIGDCKLLIAGSGDESIFRLLKERVKQLNMESDVLFPGWVEGREKGALIAGARLMVLVSENENFGVSVVEAMAAGVPVLINKGVYIYTDVEQANAGWICDNDSELSDLLSVAVSDQDECKVRGENARKLVNEKYAWPAIGGRLEELYREIVG